MVGWTNDGGGVDNDGGGVDLGGQGEGSVPVDRRGGAAELPP